jgi:dCTP deaminase
VILTHNELVKLVKDGAIENVRNGAINGGSIDLTMGGTFMVESDDRYNGGVVDLAAKETPAMREVKGPLSLQPHQFCLAHTLEVFHLPHDITGLYVLKSSLARAALNHLNAGFADPGWHGSVLTLEYHNVLRWHSLILREGCPAGQMIFWRGEEVPHEMSYAATGQYNGSKTVQASKGVR